MWQEAEAVFLFVGGLLYLTGTIGVTIACNVPRNKSLAALEPDSAGSPAKWANDVSSGTAWNHVRTIATLAAAALHTVALCLR